jgi:hypothetical protein
MKAIPDSATTITALPPPIYQFFTPDLLWYPCPRFGEDSDDLWGYYLIVLEMEYKCRHDPIRSAEFQKLKAKFLEVYERIKKKEEEYEAKEGEPWEEPFYYFDGTDKMGREIRARLRTRSFKKLLHRRGNEVQETGDFSDDEYWGSRIIDSTEPQW